MASPFVLFPPSFFLPRLRDFQPTEGDSSVSCPPQVLCSLCTAQRRVEAAGRAFLERFERPSRKAGAGVSPGRAKDKDAKRGDESDEDFSAVDEERWKSKRKGKTAGSGGGGACFASSTRLKRLLGEAQTLYEVLGVHEGTTTEEIKKQYRRLVLEHHPDKAVTRRSPGSSEEGASGRSSPHSAKEKREELTDGQATSEASADAGHARFLKIQEAYEALTDTEFRRQYDSALPFDDSIPSASAAKTPEDFFAAFGPVFQSNARWSSRRPVPSLGDAQTPMSRVRSFYDFWFDFQSWRDFGVHDEYDLNEAECREERRWMERENLKIRKKHVKAERARIQKLVETAYSVDPRVLMEKESAKKKREEEKAARQRVAEEQRRQREEEELRKKQEAEERERRENEARTRELQEQRRQRECHKKWRQRTRQFHALFCRDSHPQFLDSLQLQDLCQKLDLHQLRDLCGEIQKVACIETPLVDESGESPAPLPEGLGEASPETCQKVGDIFARRMHQMKEADRIKEEEQMKENARRQAERKAQEEAKRLARQSSWTPDELSLLAKGLQKFPGGTARRWKLIADLIGTKTQEEVVEKTKEMSEGASLKAMGSKISQVAFDQFRVHNQGAFKKIDADPDRKDVGETRPQTAASPAKEPQETAESTDWTPAQQMALEKALAKHPATMPANERWTAIAAEVPGKTKKECVERFRQIRAAILAKKSS
ncbi:DnaJ domain-containing protein [Toxoplasma gondii ME49]|uniref:DnaJ domain-containing protein n=1 Tax=Toxoplasma gondii (strain ATCC 50611 / Me49) TaxID=508771 RepID=S8GNH8_TOXGM|nr:DnaJ domain-containing protein [Toxoplasma gondii ME49]EPT30129.1 DnaJ domain-containing protein [Toxoplasma gondii ME49]|eukprot:XP_018637356.1 DnaJ domain-containing protein [Toxoplasma gondii ME49]